MEELLLIEKLDREESKRKKQVEAKEIAISEDSKSQIYSVPHIAVSLNNKIDPQSPFIKNLTQ